MFSHDRTPSSRIPAPLLTGLLIPAALLVIFVLVPPHAFDLSVSRLFFADGWPWHQDEAFKTIFYRLPKIIPAVAAGALLVYLALVLAQGRRILEEEAPRRALYVVIAMAACASLVWWLKTTTGVSCPWSIDLFGGTAPLTNPVFGLSGLPGRCWPSGHAGTGFVFLAFYFALKDVHPRAAAAALLFAVTFGLLCGAARVMEGAHFVSHVLVTGVVDWLVCAALHALILSGRTPSASGGPLSERALVILTAFWWTFVFNAPFLARAARPLQSAFCLDRPRGPDARRVRRRALLHFRRASRAGLDAAPHRAPHRPRASQPERRSLLCGHGALRHCF